MKKTVITLFLAYLRFFFFYVRHHKSGFQLSRLRKKFPEVYDEFLTEEEICAAAGYYRCYDDGKVRWAMSLDN